MILASWVLVLLLLQVEMSYMILNFYLLGVWSSPLLLCRLNFFIRTILERLVKYYYLLNSVIRIKKVPSKVKNTLSSILSGLKFLKNVIFEFLVLLTIGIERDRP